MFQSHIRNIDRNYELVALKFGGQFNTDRSQQRKNRRNTTQHFTKAEIDLRSGAPTNDATRGKIQNEKP
jgi:hypothetical protein